MKIFFGKKAAKKAVSKSGIVFAGIKKWSEWRRKWYQRINFFDKNFYKGVKKIFKGQNDDEKTAKKMVSFLRMLILGEKNGCKR